MKKNKEKIKYFLSSMIFTLMAFVLFAGFVIAEKNTRKVTLGVYDPLISFCCSNSGSDYLTLRFMDYKISLDITSVYQTFSKIIDKI